MSLHVQEPPKPLRVVLECGHSRTLDHPASKAECWVCGVDEAVVGSAT